MIVSFFRRTAFVFGGIALCLLLSAFLAPPFLDRIETLFNTPLPYEGALRFYIALAWFIFLLAWLWWLLRKGTYQAWVLFGIVTVTYSVTLGIFIGDRNHRLMEEFSWIRYTTTFFLIAASLCAAYLGRLQFRERLKLVGMLWTLFAGGFFFAGLDEVFEIHEKIGKAIETTTGFSHAVTDYVTIGYAVITLTMLLLTLRSFLSSYRERNRQPLIVLCLGAVFYLSSTIFDTFDVVVIKKLGNLARALSVDTSFIFSDAWYIIWSPKNFLNGIEEVFEQSAAMLFFAALTLMIIERTILLTSSSSFSNARKRVASLVAVGIGVLLVSSAFSLGRSIKAVSPIQNNTATVIAGPLDGLRHTDDLFFHSQWGVLIANEGKGNIYRFVDNRLIQIPDPEKKVADTDSVTATDETILAASGAKGAIFEYSPQEGWRKKWDKTNGLVHPEALVVVENAVYILDESQKTITKLSDTAKPIIWKPEDQEWKAPEGIVYNKENGKLYITDDESGVLFEVEFEKSVRPIAKLKQPEDIAMLSDGSFLVTDNAWGAVFHITREGTVSKKLQFSRPYRDLQGITVDDEGRLYVIAADGYDSTSFMPSFLFRIDSL